jgi:hypothetical protein
MALGDAANLLLHRVSVGVDVDGDSHSRPSSAVMAGLVPAIHVLLKSENGERLGLFHDQSAQRQMLNQSQVVPTSVFSLVRHNFLIFLFGYF